MAKLTEIEPATEQPKQKKPVQLIEDDVSDDEDIAQESLLDRIKALEDMFPAHSREALIQRLSTGADYALKGAKVLGNIMWILTTSALVTVLPVMYAMEQEQQIVAFEQEHLASQQANQALLGQQQQQMQAMSQPPKRQ